MEQTHIYNFLGMDNDPIFNRILKLRIGQAVEMGGVTISLNEQGLYEVETSERHECFNSKRQVYDGLSDLLSLTVL